MMTWFRPDTPLEIELRPIRLQHFSFSGTSEYQETQRISGILVVVGIQRIQEAAQFLL
jgi:hypothetical protein